MLPDDAPKTPKPRTGSLFKTMSLDTVTLDDALRLLSLPRVVGVDPESASEITAQNGRYGPYLKKGTDSRSLESEEQLFDITLEQALAIYAQPKQRGRQAGRAAARARQRPGDRASRSWSRRAASAPTSPTARRTRPCARPTPSRRVTIERAAELLAEKRAKGPAPKKRAAAKKTTAKKTTARTAKKTTKKAAAKK